MHSTVEAGVPPVTLRSTACSREYQDVAAVVDTVAAAAGQPVSVYGHSHGGIVVFGAAAMTTNVRRFVLYEGLPVPDPLFTSSRLRL